MALPIFTYRADQGVLWIAGVSNPESCDCYFEIPSELNGIRVIGVDPEAFKDNKKLESVGFTEGVRIISRSAFEGCESLSWVKFPKSIEQIDADAFKGCNRTESIQIEDVASWCEVKFGNVHSNPLSRDEDYNDGGRNGAYGSVLLNGVRCTDLTIPEGVTEISDFAFLNCYDLDSVRFPRSLRSVGAYAFLGCNKVRFIQTQ